MRRSVALLLGLLLGSCGQLPRPAQAHLEAVAAGPATSPDLVVLLPGRRSLPRDFEKNGFFEIAARKWPGARIVAPDLHLAYYKDRSAVRRLHDDVIGPVVAAGARRVHLVGISLGGMGAVLYASAHPEEVSDMTLLSPYLGEEEVIAEISRSGLKTWRPDPLAGGDFSRELWLQLQRDGKREQRIPTVLGCGNQDRFASASRLYAREFLKPKDVRWVDGIHDWPPWQRLFAELPAPR